MNKLKTALNKHPYLMMILMNVIQDIVDCKRCTHKASFIGSLQNGFGWYCRKCLYLTYADEKENPNKSY